MSRVSLSMTAIMVLKLSWFDICAVETVTAMKTAGKGRIYDIWQQVGGKKSGTWPELFGWEAGEFMTAWSIANYIDGVAEAEKSLCYSDVY